jgi:hypothetical protein
MPNLLPPAPVTYERFIYLERIPTASMLIRVMKAPRSPTDGKVLSLENTHPEKYEELGVLMHAPAYHEGIYSKPLTLSLNPIQIRSISLILLLR